MSQQVKMPLTFDAWRITWQDPEVALRSLWSELHAEQVKNDKLAPELAKEIESRLQGQKELADLKEKLSRIGLDIDRAMGGEVNKESPIATRLHIIAMRMEGGAAHG